jgi:transcriptional regulator with XRE-family HTH domain
MKSADFLDALQRKFNVKSDRKLAAQLGWPGARVSKYRTGSREFDEQTCAAVAQLLNVSPAYVMAEIQAERADCTEVKEEWRAVAKMLKGIRTSAKRAVYGLLLGLAILGGAPESSQAAGFERATVYTLYALMDRS